MSWMLSVILTRTRAKCRWGMLKYGDVIISDKQNNLYLVWQSCKRVRTPRNFLNHCYCCWYSLTGDHRRTPGKITGWRHQHSHGTDKQPGPSVIISKCYSISCKCHNKRCSSFVCSITTPWGGTYAKACLAAWPLCDVCVYGRHRLALPVNSVMAVAGG